jgi:hypothetical protein
MDYNETKMSSDEINLDIVAESKMTFCTY